MEPAYQKILDEYNQITETMCSGGSLDLAKLGKRQSELAPIVAKIENLKLKIENS